MISTLGTKFLNLLTGNPNLASLALVVAALAAFLLRRRSEPLAAGAATVDAPAWKNARLWVAILGVLFCIAVAHKIAASFEQRLWSDDLFTLVLLKASSLSHLWQGILLGIDGNPPAYLSLAWLLTHAFPHQDPETLLRLSNAGLIALGMLALYRVSRRFLSWATALLAILVFLAVSATTWVAVFELRTYALYFSVYAVCVLLLLRWMENRSRASWLCLAIVMATLPLIHSFGIIYVLCIAVGAAAAAAMRGDNRLAVSSLAAALPALCVTGAWLPFILIQSKVGQPYPWMLPPDIRAPLFFLPEILAGLLLVFALRPQVRKSAIDGRLLALFAVGLLELAFAAVAWAESKVGYPLFIARYMTPTQIVDFGILAAAMHLISRALPRAVAYAVTAAAVIVGLFFIWIPQNTRLAGAISCVEADGNTFLEDAVDVGGLPIVVESPHAWLPRRFYGRGNYVFPLDWDVVLRYPYRARNNATDFHIMQGIRSWGPSDGILTTEELLARYPAFFMLQEDNRAWFENLGRTRPLRKQKIASGDGCTLWRVEQGR